MVKKIVAAFAAFSLVFLAGCGGNSNNQTTEITQSTTEAPPLAFTSYNIRTDGYKEGVKYPVITLIKSKADLENYYAKNKDDYFLEKRKAVPPYTSVGFISFADNFNDEYFKDNYIVLVLLEESSGSVRLKVTQVEQNGSAAVITIRRDIAEVGTTDMAQWHIFVQLEKAVYNGSEFKVLFVDNKTATSTGD